MKSIIDSVSMYYSSKLLEHGPTPNGVDWNSLESQIVRFEQISKIITLDSPSVVDFGCGYGAFSDFLSHRYKSFSYQGYDISRDMINESQRIHPMDSKLFFSNDLSQIAKSDYCVASGIFNVKLTFSHQEWEEYVNSSIDLLASLSNDGFAFNMLTSYSDKEFMRENLYYADPTKIFDLCKRKYSRNVSLLHDYNLYEFTILVRL